MNVPFPPEEPAPELTRAEIQAGLLHALEQRGVLKADTALDLRQRAEWSGRPLEDILRKERLLGETELLDLLAEITRLPKVSLVRRRVDPDIVERVPVRVVTTHDVMPLEMTHGVLVLATGRARDAEDTHQLRALLGYAVQWVLALPEEIAECIRHHYGVGAAEFLGLRTGGTRRTEGATGGERDVPDFIRVLIADAVRARATDLHFEPSESRLRLRYRIDGVLTEAPLPTGLERVARALISSLKIMAQMNIAEHRIPQDGRFDLNIDGQVFDIRVSVLPSQYGESIDLRVLNRNATFLRLDQLGIPEAARRELMSLIQQPYGVVLFTGPTGSGKTTSLYAALAQLNTAERKIITLEDPIEYRIPGITQMQIEPVAGFTFASGLRAILRHDPNIVLIGEIRDEETAEIAASAALTGHLVFSTLHTNDSAGGITRLLDMGIEPYLLTSCLSGTVAQRLVRCLCPHCKEEVDLDSHLWPELQAAFPHLERPPRVWRGVGCAKCRFTGYQGRRPIFEILEITDSIRPMILERASSSLILKQAATEGLVTLRRRAWEYVLEGLTSVEELSRVTRPPRPGRAAGTVGFER